MSSLIAAAAALVFVALMSRLDEPVRRSVNAVFVALIGGTYLSGGGFGAWELAYLPVAGALAYLGLRSFRMIGVAWLLHAGWDLLHHAQGRPVWPDLASSSIDCAVFDGLIALWFLAGAPGRERRSDERSGAAPS